MQPKSEKRQYLENNKEKIMVEWSDLTYDEIRKKLFEETGLEYTRTMINDFRKENGRIYTKEQRDKNNKKLQEMYKKTVKRKEYKKNQYPLLPKREINRQI